MYLFISSVCYFFLLLWCLYSVRSFCRMCLFRSFVIYLFRSSAPVLVICLVNCLVSSLFLPFVCLCISFASYWFLYLVRYFFMYSVRSFVREFFISLCIPLVRYVFLLLVISWRRHIFRYFRLCLFKVCLHPCISVQFSFVPFVIYLFRSVMISFPVREFVHC